MNISSFFPAIAAPLSSCAAVNAHRPRISPLAQTGCPPIIRARSSSSCWRDLHPRHCHGAVRQKISMASQATLHSPSERIVARRCARRFGCGLSNLHVFPHASQWRDFLSYTARGRGYGRRSRRTHDLQDRARSWGANGTDAANARPGTQLQTVTYAARFTTFASAVQMNVLSCIHAGWPSPAETFNL
jgi:hypothetical protein